MHFVTRIGYLSFTRIKTPPSGPYFVSWAPPETFSIDEPDLSGTDRIKLSCQFGDREAVVFLAPSAALGSTGGLSSQKVASWSVADMLTVSVTDEPAGLLRGGRSWVQPCFQPCFQPSLTPKSHSLHTVDMLT